MITPNCVTYTANNMQAGASLTVSVCAAGDILSVTDNAGNTYTQDIAEKIDDGMRWWWFVIAYFAMVGIMLHIVFIAELVFKWLAHK